MGAEETSGLGPSVCLQSPEISGMMAIQGCHKLMRHPDLTLGTHFTKTTCSESYQMILYPKEKRAFDWNLISPRSDLIIIFKNQPGFLSSEDRPQSCLALPVRASPLSQANQYFGLRSISVSLLRAPVITELLRFYWLMCQWEGPGAVPLPVWGCNVTA